MVSLSRDISSLSGGHVFFSDASMSSHDDDGQTQHILGDGEREFKTLNTVAVAVFQLLLAAGIFVLALLLDLLWPASREECKSFFILQYVHAIFWCISFIVHHYLKTKHHTLRVDGYLEFYQETYNHFRIPFYIVSAWNAVLLVVGTVFHQVYKDFEDRCKSQSFLTPNTYHCFIIAMEVASLAPCLIIYIRKVHLFNRGQPLPDVQREEWMSNFIQESYSAGDVGYKERGAFLSDLLEKQADVIRYLKERNIQLGRRVMDLHSQLRYIQIHSSHE